MFPLSLKSLTFDLLSLLLVLPRTTAAWDPNVWMSARASFLLPAMTTVLCYEKTLFQFYMNSYSKHSHSYLWIKQFVNPHQLSHIFLWHASYFLSSTEFLKLLGARLVLNRIYFFSRLEL